MTARLIHFHRSGTNYNDDVAVAAVRDLGYVVVGHSVLGDAGATYNREQVELALLQAKPAAQVVMHAKPPGERDRRGSHGGGATAVGKQLPLRQSIGVYLADILTVVGVPHPGEDIRGYSPKWYNYCKKEGLGRMKK